jgi:hypothetical protein
VFGKLLLITEYRSLQIYAQRKGYVAITSPVNYVENRKKNTLLERKRVIGNKSETRLVEARSSFMRDHVESTTVAKFDNKRYLFVSRQSR